MQIIKIRSLLSILLLMFIVNGAAMAKDDVLEQDMVDLEGEYIPALFLTSQVPVNTQVTPEMAIQAMSVYVDSWESFRDYYITYRSSWRNWISYFSQVQLLVNEAVEEVDNNHFLEAHEVLELVRTTMREFRGRNGFPKFITDELTAFHTIMGDIIAISNSTFDDDTIAILSDLYNKGSHAWFKVEKNTVDQYAWGLSDAEMMAYNEFIIAERAALDQFETALSGFDGNPTAIIAAASGLKPAQAKAYLLLGNFPQP